MKLKTQNATVKNQKNTKKNDKSPKPQNKGAAKEKVKPIKPAVLKKEGEKVKAEVKTTSPVKILQNELWTKAIKVIADKSDLSAKESGIAKLLANYKKQDSIPRKQSKLKNFILKGFSQYKDTESEILDSLYSKIMETFKTLGGQTKDGDSETKKSNNKADKSSPKTKNQKKVVAEKNDDEEVEDDDDENDDDDDDDIDEDEDDIEDAMFADSDEDVEGDSEEEVKETKPAGKNKPNKKQVKNGNNKANVKNNQKFKGGKVQKNKGKFNKKK